MIKLLQKFFLASFFLISPYLISYEGRLEVRAGAFVPVSSRFQQVYGDVAPDYQIEAGYVLSSNLELWANLDWFTKHRSQNGCCKTNIDITNGSLGINYLFPTENAYQFYAGIGPAFAKIILKNRICGDHSDRSKFSCGLVAKGGVRYAFSSNIYLDLFTDYNYQPLRFHHRDVDVGGFKTGLGLGYYF